MRTLLQLVWRAWGSVRGLDDRTAVRRTPDTIVK
jgi:hypothetical protein